MGYRYLDAAVANFGHSPFTVLEFGEQTKCRRPGKVLSEMRARGELVRESRGGYRVMQLAQRDDAAQREWQRVRTAILEAPLEWAWADASAWAQWTAGRGVGHETAHRRIFHIAVRARDRDQWTAWLRRRYVPQGRKAIGASVTLHAWPRGQPAVVVEGEPTLWLDGPP